MIIIKERIYVLFVIIMRTYFSLDFYKGTVSSVRELQAHVEGSAFDGDGLSKAVTRFNVLLGTLAALRGEVNSTSLDGLHDLAKEKSLVCDEIDLTLHQVLKTLRSIFMKNIFQCTDMQSSFKFLFTEFLKLRKLSYEDGLEYYVKPSVSAVVSHLSHKYELDLSVRSFPGYGVLEVVKSFKKTSYDFDLMIK